MSEQARAALTPAQEAMGRWLAEWHRRERAVARSLGIPVSALRAVTTSVCARVDGQELVSSAYGRIPRRPAGYRAALRAGLVGGLDRYPSLFGIGFCRCRTTPEGRRAIWTYYQAIADMPPRTDPCWLVAP